MNTDGHRCGIRWMSARADAEGSASVSICVHLWFPYFT